MSLAVTAGGYAGAGFQLKAVASFSDGTTLDVTTLATWESSSQALATVSTSGLVTVVEAGDVRFVATYKLIPGELRKTIIQTRYTLSGRVFPIFPNLPRFLAGVMVEITSGPDSGRSAVTDANGRYAITGLRASVLNVRATPAGYSPWRLTGLDLQSDQNLDATLFPNVPVNAEGVRATAQCNDASWTYSSNVDFICRGHDGLAWGVCPGPICDASLQVIR